MAWSVSWTANPFAGWKVSAGARPDYRLGVRPDSGLARVKAGVMAEDHLTTTVLQPVEKQAWETPRVVASAIASDTEYGDDAPSS